MEIFLDFKNAALAEYDVNKNLNGIIIIYKVGCSMQEGIHFISILYFQKWYRHSSQTEEVSFFEPQTETKISCH